MRCAETFDLADLPTCAFELPATGERIIRDAVAPGLALRLRSSGARTWVVLTNEAGKTVRHTLGDAAAIPLPLARGMASASPIAPAPDAPPTAPLFKPNATLADLVPPYLAHAKQAGWKPGSIRGVESQARLWVLPALGAQKARSLSAPDVARWYDDISLRAKGARNALTMLSGLMLYAEDHGLRPVGSNPCQGLRKKTLSERGDHLPATTIRKLWQALDRLQSRLPDSCDAVRLLLLTGARRNEILHLAWDRITGSRAVLEDSKTGPRTVWLNAPARQILERRRTTSDSPLVFPGKVPDHPITAIDYGWQLIRKEARIKALRVHDLRHHFASVAVSNGIDLKVVGQLLGHKDIESTLGYAHLATAALVRSAANVSTLIGDAMRIDDGAIRSELVRPPRRSRSRVKRRIPAWKAVSLRAAETAHG